jgi:hypothetical protein
MPIAAGPPTGSGILTMATDGWPATGHVIVGYDFIFG